MVAAELCYLAGVYYETNERPEDAVYWFKKAAFEAEAYVCIQYGGTDALREVIRLLHRLEREDEAVYFEQLLGQETEVSDGR